MKSTKTVNRAARALFRLCLTDGALDEQRARLVGTRLATSPRRGAIAVLVAFQRLVRLDRARRTALVESATPLDAGPREAILTRLGRRYGSRLETSFAENAALIGGVRITVGSDVYDGSVRAKLAKIASRL